MLESLVTEIKVSNVTQTSFIFLDSSSLFIATVAGKQKKYLLHKIIATHIFCIAAWEVRFKAFCHPADWLKEFIPCLFHVNAHDSLQSFGSCCLYNIPVRWARMRVSNGDGRMMRVRVSDGQSWWLQEKRNLNSDPVQLPNHMGVHSHLPRGQMRPAVSLSVARGKACNTPYVSLICTIICNSYM